jgi:hypothetical protein
MNTQRIALRLMFAFMMTCAARGRGGESVAQSSRPVRVFIPFATHVPIEKVSSTLVVRLRGPGGLDLYALNETILCSDGCGYRMTAAQIGTSDQYEYTASMLLSPGEHTIRLEGVSEPVPVTGITFTPAAEWKRMFVIDTVTTLAVRCTRTPPTTLACALD